jgi:hypothetical protein
MTKKSILIFVAACLLCAGTALAQTTGKKRVYMVVEKDGKVQTLDETYTGKMPAALRQKIEALRKGASNVQYMELEEGGSTTAGPEVEGWEEGGELVATVEAPDGTRREVRKQFANTQEMEAAMKALQEGAEGKLLGLRMTTRSVSGSAPADSAAAAPKPKALPEGWTEVPGPQVAVEKRVVTTPDGKTQEEYVYTQRDSLAPKERAAHEALKAKGLQVHSVSAHTLSATELQALPDTLKQFLIGDATLSRHVSEVAIETDQDALKIGFLIETQGDTQVQVYALDGTLLHSEAKPNFFGAYQARVPMSASQMAHCLLHVRQNGQVFNMKISVE